MPVLTPPDYPHEWPAQLAAVMLTPVGAESGALFDAIDADALLFKKRGRLGASAQNHLLLRERQLRSRAMWKGVAAGYVLMLTLAKAEAGEKRKGFKTAMSEVQSALKKRLDSEKAD